ncbi:unnamed protein product [Amoebophrya sp. A25]|nr:unnamed protein product [Amoebophrya sp. A25]|eukprot:GSA25T00014556001.1
MPLVPIGDAASTRVNTLWAESTPGRGDWHPFDKLQIGDCMRFHGTHCRHFAVQYLGQSGLCGNREAATKTKSDIKDIGMSEENGTTIPERRFSLDFRCYVVENEEMKERGQALAGDGKKSTSPPMKKSPTTIQQQGRLPYYHERRTMSFHLCGDPKVARKIRTPAQLSWRRVDNATSYS